MVDREKVIKALECCTTLGCHYGCPYADKMTINCTEYLKADALALLKEHEPIKPKSKVRHGANAQIQHFCGNCNSMLHGKPKFCSECGKEVLW